MAEFQRTGSLARARAARRGEVMITAAGAGLLVLTALFALTPDLPKPIFFHHQDKLEHLAGFALLAGLFGVAVDRSARIAVVLALIVFAGAIEVFQGLAIQGRTGDMADFLASAVGAVGAGFAATALRGWLTGPRRVGAAA
ncbi:MAG: VanZ family protein [Caulobacterales bacterium]|nr:VanZ family protein [Caulobacterales bacterium]